jgi:tetratricopeptide (TPR) repeat protein
LVWERFLLESTGLATLNRCQANYPITMRANPQKSLPTPLTALLVGLALNGMIAFATADEFSDAERLLKQGQSPEALEKVDSYIAGRPKEARGRFLKGLILIEMGQPTEAMAVFSALSEDYPELPEPYNNLAVVYAQQKQYEKARTALEMAIRTDPGYALARENLGDVYARLASQAYDQALQLDPSNKVTQSKLSRLREPGSSVSVNPGKQADAARPSSGTGKTGFAAQARGTAATPAGAAAAKPVDKVSAAATPAAQARVQTAAAGNDAPKSTPAMTTSQGPVATSPPNEATVQGWDLIFSPYTFHFNPDKDHKPVVAIGLLKGLEGRWLAGGAVFSNSFGQPSAYAFAGQRYLDPFGFENWYLQWTAGLLYGYVGEYEDKVPLNYKGFSPGFVPSLGYRFSKRIYGQLDLLGTSALMFTIVAPLPKDWP